MFCQDMLSYHIENEIFVVCSWAFAFACNVTTYYMALNPVLCHVIINYMIYIFIIRFILNVYKLCSWSPYVPPSLIQAWATVLPGKIVEPALLCYSSSTVHELCIAHNSVGKS